VYAGNHEPLVFTVPPGYGNVWHVFDLNGETGEIVPVHSMSNQSEPGKIDYPVIVSTPGDRAYWDTPYAYQVKATDPDNDPLVYALDKAPAGMTIDSATGLVQWRPSGAQSGRYYVTVKVTDDRCGEVTQSFSIYVYLSQPPSLRRSLLRDESGRRHNPELEHNPGRDRPDRAGHRRGREKWLIDHPVTGGSNDLYPHRLQRRRLDQTNGPRRAIGIVLFFAKPDL